MARRRRRLPEGSFTADVTSLCEDGRGLATVEQRPVRLTAALAGERVRFRYLKRARRFDEGAVESVERAAPERVTPRCAHFGVCGGCVFQHLEHGAQLALKQQRVRALFDAAEIPVGAWMPPLTGPLWGYRNKARLGAKWLAPKELALVGFRERGNGLVAVTERCEILHPAIGTRIDALRELLADLQLRDRIPQIEVAVGDEGAALVFRHLEPLAASDRAALTGFARDTGLSVYLQAGGPDTVEPLWPQQPAPLTYVLPDVDVRLSFEPLDFTQVNPGLNRLMVNRAIELLQPSAQDRVLDLFSGLGNFTMPLARSAGQVVGLEGADELVAKGRRNAAMNDIGNAEFYAVDLNEPDAVAFWLDKGWNKLLLDPPRSGALEVVGRVPATSLQKILYVSCHPESLARDAAVLVHDKGYRLARLGIVDMFPHTNHVESMALFEADPTEAAH